MPEPGPTVKRYPFELLLLIYKSPLFKAHWALFIERKEHCHGLPLEENTGTLIQVNGDIRSGFYFEVDKGYSPKKTSRITEKLSLGPIKPPATDDDIIALAEKIQPPSPSLRSSESGTKTRIEVKDCQYWVTEVVKELDAEGLIDGGYEKLNGAPKH